MLIPSKLFVLVPTCTNTMSAPASARAKAIAWPMPRVPPVTRAVLPVKENKDVTVAAIVGIICAEEKERERILVKYLA